MWVKEVNAAGGLKLGDKRVPIEVVQYDDRSSAEEAARGLERLITQDKVDFILPPWGTGLNLAVGPILNKAGYPHLASTAVTDRAPELAKRWPNSFWLLGTSAGAANTLVELLVKLRERRQDRRHRRDGQRRRRFRHRPVGRGAAGLTKANFKLAYDKTYPVGTQDSEPAASTRRKALNPDVFIAFSYPPDTHRAHRTGEDRRLQSQDVLHRRRHRRSRCIKQQVRRQYRGRDGDRRLERRQRGDQGLPGTPQGGVGQRRGAGSLGQRR